MFHVDSLCAKPQISHDGLNIHRPAVQSGETPADTPAEALLHMSSFVERCWSYMGQGGQDIDPLPPIRLVQYITSMGHETNRSTIHSKGSKPVNPTS